MLLTFGEGGTAKITEFKVIALANKDIGRFDVSMDDPHLVEVLNPSYQLIQCSSCRDAPLDLIYF